MTNDAPHPLLSGLLTIHTSVGDFFVTPAAPVFTEPIGPRDLTPEPNPFRNDWRAELRALGMRTPHLSQEYFEFLEDQAYAHLPNCPRLLDRPCKWCAEEGVILTTENLRRERALKELIPTITRVTLP